MGLGVSQHPGQRKRGGPGPPLSQAGPAHPYVPVPSVQGAGSTHRGTPKLGQTLDLSVSVEYTAGSLGGFRCQLPCCLLIGHTGLFQQLGHLGGWPQITNSERRGRLREAEVGSRSHSRIGGGGTVSPLPQLYTPCWLWGGRGWGTKGCEFIPLLQGLPKGCELWG